MRQPVQNADRAVSTPASLSRGASERSLEYSHAKKYIFVFYIIIALVIYGSLYPFNFSAENIKFLDVEKFITHWRVVSRPGDILGNFALFVPYGCVGMLALLPHRSPVARFVLLSLIGLFVATSVQVLQIFLPTRDAALGDVIWNSCGWSLGAVLVWPRQIRARLLSHAGSSIQVFPFCLLAGWALGELAPFVPSVDLQSFKDSLKPLIDSPGVFTFEFYRVYSSWLVVFYLVTRLWPDHLRSLWLFCGAAGVLAAKVVIIQNSVSSGDVLAVLLALLSWLLFLRTFKHRVVVLLVVLILFVVAASLEPFNIRSTLLTFSWTPFSGALTGSMLVNAKAVAAKVFILGSLLYLLGIRGFRPVVATVLVVLLMMTLEVSQVWIGNHTPEITDPLMVLFLGAVLVVFNQTPEAVGGAGTERTAVLGRRPRGSEPPRRRAQAADRTGSSQTSTLFGFPATRQGAGIALAACLAATLIMQVILGLPQIPYNVRELFGGEDAWWRLFIFSLAGLSIGLGGALVGRTVAESSRVYLALPGATILACLATYLLLVLSVSAESIWDITGSANTHWFVMNRHIWGDPGVWLYETIGSKPLIHTVERFVRFAALFGQAILWIGILSALYFRLTAQSQISATSRASLLLPAVLAFLLAAAPWLVLFNLVAFDFSSTDNLNELIGGHGHILYFLLLLLPFNALFVVHALRRPRVGTAAATMLVLAVSLPVGWLLFKNGLNPAVTKYGQVFSGVDFLLGPDREELLPETTLMFRWFAVQCTAIAGLACGMQVVPGLEGAKR